MALSTFAELSAELSRLSPRIPVAAAGANDRTVLEALSKAHELGWVDPILVGPSPEIHALTAEMHIDPRQFRILDCDAETTAQGSVALVKRGEASILMKGRISTPALMHAILDPDLGLRTGKTVCQVVLMELPEAGRRFLLADTGVCVSPGLARKLEILNLMVDLSHAIGEPEPKVAVMAATEKVDASMPETLDARELQARSERGEIKGCRVEGPLSFDLAFAEDSAVKKQVGGSVVGAADAMLFPNLTSANLTVKAIMYTASCRFGGVLMGTSRPVAFMSRADRTETRLNSLCLAARLLLHGPAA